MFPDMDGGSGVEEEYAVQKGSHAAVRGFHFHGPGSDKCCNEGSEVCFEGLLCHCRRGFLDLEDSSDVRCWEIGFCIELDVGLGF